MKTVLAKAFCALLCVATMLSYFAPACAEDPSFKITSKTEDCTILVGADLELTVSASEKIQSYKWEVSTDGGKTWPQVATTATYSIKQASQNTPANRPYQYRITVTNAANATDTAVISVLVSNDYKYRPIKLRNDNTTVSAYMHKQTRLVITPLPDSHEATVAMKKLLHPGCFPLLLCDVSLVNRSSSVPYFGKLKIDFEVGSQYDGETLHVFRYKNGATEIPTGDVTNGILSFNVDSPSPFMVEVLKPPTHTVTVNAGYGGSVSPSETVYVADGSDKTFTILPIEGYEISAVTVDGSPLSFTGNSFTLNNITKDTTVSVSFNPVTPSEVLHTVTIDSPAHGSVFPGGEITVRHGSAQTIYFYPESGYELNSVKVNDVDVNVVGNSYTLSAVTSDTTVVTTFSSGTSQPPDDGNNIAASSDGNGSISPLSDIKVEYGGSMYFYFIPHDGYEVNTVSIDGAPITVSGNAYRFDDVTKGHRIHVTFKPRVAPPPLPSSPSLRQYQIIKGQNGEWWNGSRNSLSFTADADYGKFTCVMVDGVWILSDKYTVQSGSTIVALKDSYLKTLSFGPHTLRVNFTDGYAETKFTVNGYVDIPKTGDNPQPLPWLGVALLAGAGLASGVVFGRRKRQNV